MLPRLPNTREGNSDNLVHVNNFKLLIWWCDIKAITSFVNFVLLHLQSLTKESKVTSLSIQLSILWYFTASNADLYKPGGNLTAANGKGL